MNFYLPYQIPDRLYINMHPMVIYSIVSNGEHETQKHLASSKIEFKH